MAGMFFSQMSVVYFCRGFSCCLYYRGVHYDRVSTRRELTVFNKCAKQVVIFLLIE